MIGETREEKKKSQSQAEAGGVKKKAMSSRAIPFSGIGKGLLSCLLACVGGGWLVVWCGGGGGGGGGFGGLAARGSLHDATGRPAFCFRRPRPHYKGRRRQKKIVPERKAYRKLKGNGRGKKKKAEGEVEILAESKTHMS